MFAGIGNPSAAGSSTSGAQPSATDADGGLAEGIPAPPGYEVLGELADRTQADKAAPNLDELLYLGPALP